MSFLVSTVTVTFDFALNAQSFTSTPGANTTMAWDNANGNPSGSLSSTITGRNLSNANKWTRTLTYEALGVPPGATVIGIGSASMQSRCTTYTTGATSTAGSVTLLDGGTTVTLAVSRNFSATDASWVTSNGTTVNGLSSASTTSVTITINNTLATANSASASVVLKQDNLTFVITYIPVIGQSSDIGWGFEPSRGYRQGVISNRDGLSGVKGLNLSAIVNPADTTKIFRGPITYKWQRRDYSSVYRRDDGSTSTPLQFVTFTKPFHQDDWPVPQGKSQGVITNKFGAQLNNTILTPPVVQAADFILRAPQITKTEFRNWIRVLESTKQNNLIETTLFSSLPAIVNLRNPTQWRYTPVSPWVAVKSEGLSRSKIELIGQDTFYGDPGEVPGFEFPQPRIITRLPAGHVKDSVDLFLLLLNVKPFHQDHWPLTYPKPFTLRTHLNNNQQNTLSVQIFNIILAAKSWVWANNPENITLNLAYANKSWQWNPKGLLQNLQIGPNKAWNWQKTGQSDTFFINSTQQAWNWLTNTFVTPTTIAFGNKSWTWRANPITSFGSSTLKKLLMLLGVGT